MATNDDDAATKTAPETAAAAGGAAVQTTAAATAAATAATATASPTAASPTAACPAAAATATATTAGLLPAQHWLDAAEHRDAADADTDADSALGDDNASSTASISSTILEYRTINGRTYHCDRGDTQYWASNDEVQNESLDIIHHLLTLSLDGKLYLAPLDRARVRRALDVGTGTGIWAIDFADEFPQADVIGTDISPIQPAWVPPNLKFELDDFTEPWTFGADSFDYVHMRYLYGSVPDWAALIRQAFRVTAPGGWLECFDASTTITSDDGSVAPDSAMAEWGKFFNEGARTLGRVFSPIYDDLLEKGMRDAGFVDISVKKMKVPIGDWPKDEKLKEIGRFSQFSLESDTDGYVSFMANQLLGWGREQVAVYCAQFRRELRSKKAHAYYHQRCVWGRKPESHSV